MRKHIIVELDQLKPFSGILHNEKGNETTVEGNPFYVPDDYLTKDDKDSESIRRLHTSIIQEGLLTPLLVRPSKAEEGRYEILSGYRRKKVCEELSKSNPKFSKIPVVVIDCDDDTASSIITSSNVQRREISLLDTIKSCGRMYWALNHRGRKNDKGETAEIVSQITGINPRTVRRYSHLLNLPEEMLQLVGNKVKTQTGELRLPIYVGDALISLKKEQLEVINNLLKEDDSKTITFEQARTLKKLCKEKTELTPEDVEQVISSAGVHSSSDEQNLEQAVLDCEENNSTTVKKRKISFNNEKLKTYCQDMTDKQIEELIYELLEKWVLSPEYN